MVRVLVYNTPLTKRFANDVQSAGVRICYYHKTRSGSFLIAPVTFDAYFAIAGVELSEEVINSICGQYESYKIEAVSEQFARKRAPACLVRRAITPAARSTNKIYWFRIPNLCPFGNVLDAGILGEDLICMVASYATQFGMDASKLQFVPYCMPFKDAFKPSSGAELLQLGLGDKWKFTCPGWYDIPDVWIINTETVITIEQFASSATAVNEVELSNSLPWAYIKLSTSDDKKSVYPKTLLSTNEQQQQQQQGARPFFSSARDAVIKSLKDICTNHSNTVMVFVDAPAEKTGTLHYCDKGTYDTLRTLFGISQGDIKDIQKWVLPIIFIPIMSNLTTPAVSEKDMMTALATNVNTALAVATTTNAPLALCLYDLLVGTRARQIATHFVAHSLLEHGYCMLPLSKETSSSATSMAGGESIEVTGGDFAPAKTGVFFRDKDSQAIFIVDYNSFYVSIFCERNMCLTSSESDLELTEKPLTFAEHSPVPGAMARLLNRRRQTKDPVLKAALKRAGNATYGSFRSPEFRFYVAELANCITFWGRVFVRRLRADVSQYCCNPHDVGMILSATDSVAFVTTKIRTAGQLKDIMEEVAKIHGYQYLKIGDVIEWASVWVVNKQHYVFLPVNASSSSSSAGGVEIKGLYPIQKKSIPQAAAYITDAFNRVLKGDSAEEFGIWLRRLLNTLDQITASDQQISEELLEERRRIKHETLNHLAVTYKELYSVYSEQDRIRYFPQDFLRFSSATSATSVNRHQRNAALALTMTEQLGVPWYSAKYFETELKLT